MNIPDKSGTSFDFEAHRIKAIADYQKLRPIYAGVAVVVKKILEEAFNTQKVRFQSIEARAKEIDSFGRKVVEQSDTDPSKPKYPTPILNITDLSGVRVITFFPRTLKIVDGVIQSEFDVIEKSDKAEMLIKEQKFGYASIHYLVRLKNNRTALPEYSRFRDLTTEIQVRTILQHAWAEIEHDIQYKSLDTIPTSIRRRFMSLAGMLEIADREFQAIQNEDDAIRKHARISVQEGKLGQVEITPDALQAYLDKRLGADGRMSDFSYEFMARILRTMGFTDFGQVEECVSGYDDDSLSRIVWGARQGQISRFELLLQAGMGDNFKRFHIWSVEDWFPQACDRQLTDMRNAGIQIGTYLPPSKRTAKITS